MNIKITNLLIIGSLLSLLMFLFGRMSISRSVITYSVNGWPVSFNRVWPTYGLPLADYAAIAEMLQSGHSKEAIHHVDALLDIVVYDAKFRRPLLQGQDIKMLDSALVKVARYREQFPRLIDTSTNGFGNSIQLKQYEEWILEQKQIDAFLHSFVNTNEATHSRPYTNDLLPAKRPDTNDDQ